MSKKSHLKRARLKITQPRLKILNILKTNSVHHLGADDIYQIFIEENQKIGLATVYLVLAQFELAGLVIRHRFEGGPAVYELNDAAHHDHMVYVDCGKVFEFIDSDIEQRQRETATSAGFVIHDHSLYLYGKCTGMQHEGHCSMKDHPS